MIVKNEAHVIQRCLESVRPFIAYWVIVDTGSSDGTQSTIREIFKDIPGELHEQAWKNFGHNRSEALVLARGKADYVFVIDADEVLKLPADFKAPALIGDAYSLTVEYGETHYGRVCLVSNRLNWHYVGVLHEYLEADTPYLQDKLNGPTVQVYPDGARSLGVDTASKYLNDAGILEAALLEEPNNARYEFYLAQSYRDAQEPTKALAHYQRRTEMGGWVEETWFALYQIAVLSERLQMDENEVMGRYLKAYQHRPQRAEPLGQLARYCRQRQQYVLAHLFAAKAITLEMPPDLLFIDESMYRWRCLDEYAVASYWVEGYEESARCCRLLLSSGDLPLTERGRVEANMKLAVTALSQGKRIKSY